VELTTGTKWLYFFEFYRCMAASGLGNYRDAAEYAKTSSLLSPRFASPRRYMIALAAATGDHVGFDHACHALKMIEPSFNIEQLLSPKYPVNTLRRIALIK